MPIEITAVTTNDLVPAWSTRFPITSPTTIATQREKDEPYNHEERSIRWPKIRNSLDKALFSRKINRTLN